MSRVKTPSQHHESFFEMRPQKQNRCTEGKINGLVDRLDGFICDEANKAK